MNGMYVQSSTRLGLVTSAVVILVLGAWSGQAAELAQLVEQLIRNPEFQDRAVSTGRLG